MPRTLHETLKARQTTDLAQIERTLAGAQGLSDEAEIVLTVLIWRRRTKGRNGIMSAFLYVDLSSRIDSVEEHLLQVGATDSARALREMRKELPLEEEQIRHGIVDLADSNLDAASRVYQRAAELAHCVADVEPAVWKFMRAHKRSIPDWPLVEKGRLGMPSFFDKWRADAR